MKIYVSNLEIDQESDNDKIIITSFSRTIGYGEGNITTVVYYPTTATDINTAIRLNTVTWAFDAWNLEINPDDIVILGIIDLTSEVVEVKANLNSVVEAAAATTITKK